MLIYVKIEIKTPNIANNLILKMLNSAKINVIENVYIRKFVKN